MAEASVSLAGFDDAQVSMMAEECIVVDEGDVSVGAGSKKRLHLNANIDAGLLHRGSRSRAGSGLRPSSLPRPFARPNVLGRL